MYSVLSRMHALGAVARSQVSLRAAVLLDVVALVLPVPARGIAIRWPGTYVRHYTSFISCPWFPTVLELHV